MTPSIVTCRSCIASSSAACVFGGARLISSASRMFVKIGPARNSNAASRWFQIDEPVTSDGSRSGVNWTRAKSKPGDLRERPRRQRLREPRDVLEEDVAVGEHPGEDQLEPVALADDRPLDLVEDRGALARRPRSAPREPLQVVDARARRTRSAIPGAVRSAGAGRSGRTSSQTVGAEQLRRPVGAALEVDPAPEQETRRDREEERSESEVDVERRPRRERDLTLHAGKGRGPGARRDGGSECSVEA